jgi:hypothetical protein
VGIPLAFWKVIVIVTEDGRPSATAYRIGQEKDLEQLEYVFGAYATFQTSIKQVMEETGLDFGPLLDYDGFTARERATGEETETHPGRAWKQIFFDTQDKTSERAKQALVKSFSEYKTAYDASSSKDTWTGLNLLALAAFANRQGIQIPLFN